MRVVLVGGPRRGKSTLAHDYFMRGIPVFCGDPLSKVKEPRPYVTYLPEGLPFDGDGGASDWVSKNWMHMPGPWLLEGHVMARALRRFLDDNGRPPCDKIIALTGSARCESTPRQEAMHKGVMTQWGDIYWAVAHITEVIG